MNVMIIGAGPSGSYLGYLLSKSGIKNTIIEEHNQIGKPDHCTGLVSRNIEKILPYKWFNRAILNKVNGAVISCGNKSFEIKADEFKAYVFDRPVFDKAIAENAVKEGSKILLSHKYLKHEIKNQHNKKIIDITINSPKYENKVIKADVLIGADGAASKVAFDSGLFNERKFLIGKQMIAKVKENEFDKEKVYLFLDKKYSDGFFAWVVPVNEDTIKVGLASMTKPMEYFDRFIDEKLGHFKILGEYGGMIPLYKKIDVQNKDKNIFLVGDAALLVKATSGGGIINSLLSARVLCRSLKDNVDYENGLKKIRKHLWLHSFIRRKLNKMSDKKTERLLEMLNKEGPKKVLLEKGDMDFPGKFLVGLLLSNPRILSFII
ncbi:MAG: NAD(P)/FAD-dependent oxidoreductase [Candidatus Woesearchaeota archaeon]|nr:NAD(P)/FAD-dependent oxidoreductase [Candidatus Woesearchaeota archaeon]